MNQDLKTYIEVTSTTAFQERFQLVRDTMLGGYFKYRNHFSFSLYLYYTIFQIVCQVKSYIVTQKTLLFV
jgi:hypothetical protein